jgi:hypothetical protein
VDRGPEKNVSAASLRALLAHAIDYAGLFPPANLSLEPALRNYAGYLREPEAWMLGPFILPTAQFDAAGRDISQFDEQYPLRVSALGPRTDNASAFRQSLSAAMGAIASFQASCGAAASVEQFEMPLPPDVNAELLEAVRPSIAPSQLNTFWEAPADAAGAVIELMAAQNRAHPERKLGFKLRTGGVTAEAFPSSAQIARVLMAAANQEVPIKFTAGLHHPVRLFHDSVQTKMHGFLNVLGAGVLALEHSWRESEIAAMLEDENSASFSFTDVCFAWREWEISTERIRVHRELVTSLGSCSFDEPREDLRALKVL